MSDGQAQKNPAQGRVFSFLGSGGAIVELYADRDRAVSVSRPTSAFPESGRSDRQKLNEIRGR